MIEFTSVKYRKEEIEWQHHEDYPKDLKALEVMYNNSDIDVNVMEITEF